MGKVSFPHGSDHGIAAHRAGTIKNDLGSISIYSRRDRHECEHHGGLLKPPHFKSGHLSAAMRDQSKSFQA